MTFLPPDFPARLHTPHNATPHFVEVCPQIWTNYSFFLFLFSSLLHNYYPKLSSMLISCIFCFGTYNVYIALENVELVSVPSSVLCYLLRFLEN